MTGVFDYAARISGDSGTTWVYCDLDGLVINGYTPDQARQFAKRVQDAVQRALPPGDPASAAIGEPGEARA